MPNFKSGFVAIVGRPNVGKSTLLNAMTQEKIAIVSPKPQTTRTKILTIKTTDAYQMVFVDTPGVHRPKTKLGEYMNDVASGAVTDADAAIFVTEAATDKWDQDAEILEAVKKRGIPAVLVINKIDAAPKELLLPQIEKYTNAFSFSAVVPVCAKSGDGVEAVMDEVLALLGEGPCITLPTSLPTSRKSKLPPSWCGKRCCGFWTRRCLTARQWKLTALRTGRTC